MALEARRVRGEGEVLEPEGGEECHHLDERWVEKRLTAGQADAANPGPDETRGHRFPRLDLEAVLEVAVAPVRAAVDAREVAPVRQRKADRARGGRRGPRLQDGEGTHGIGRR